MSKPLLTKTDFVAAIGGCQSLGDATGVYAAAIRAMERGTNVDWPALNAAIIERWSVNGLKTVKNGAWRLA